MGRYLTITHEAGHLVADGKTGKFPMGATSENTFRSPGSPAELIFVRGTQGQVSELVINLGGLREIHAHRVN